MLEFSENVEVNPAVSQEFQSNRMSAGERTTAKLLRWLPLFVFLAVALPLPAYFLLRYFAATENVGEYMIFAMTSLAASTLFGLVAAFLAVLYRKFWERRLRERVATDGITADELSLFASELTAAQRSSLAQMEAQNPLLADAYRDTLAARITASRVLDSARREAVAVEQRLKSAAGLQSVSRGELEQDLRKDRERLSRTEREATEHQQEIETRLQIIEAMSSRGSSEAETRDALGRLGSVRDNVPYGLTAARLEQEAYEEIEQELREHDTRGKLREAKTEKELRELPPRQQDIQGG